MVGDKVKTERIAYLQAKLLEKAKSLPSKVGCYLMKGRDDRVLYVGKAKSLKARVSSYFQKGVKSPKTEILVSHILDIDFFLTQTEAEAFVLENNLIKKHSPKYNILLRDDKSYPYVVVDHGEPYPRLHYQRRVVRNKSKEVFGPFVYGSHIGEVLRILTKSFQLRDCSLREFNSRKEPCLLFQIKQCSAPCVGKISDKKYREALQLALDFFKGKGSKSLKVLEMRMHQAAENEEFEQAVIIRDSIEVLKSFLDFSQQKNAELHGLQKNIDIIAYHMGELEVDLSIYMVRNGILLGHKNFHFPVIDLIEGIEMEAANFLFQYYSQTHDSYPDVVVVSFQKKVLSLFKEALNYLQKMDVRSPGKEFSSLMLLTQDYVFEHQRVRVKNQESVFVGLNKLKELLGLKERPILLECYDVAVFQGSSPTASQIVFRDGKPERKMYRHYHLKARKEGNNDFAMMKEVLTRRVLHGELPDVFIVDGGKGQVNVFKGVLEEVGIGIPVVGIAKSKTMFGNMKLREEGVKKTQERLILPGRKNSYQLNKNRALFRILTQMRDEAHRFSRRLHHKAEKGRVLSSWLDEVKGIGPKTKALVLKRLDKTPRELLAMEINELSEYLGVSLKVSANILEVLKGRES